MARLKARNIRQLLKNRAMRAEYAPGNSPFCNDLLRNTNSPSLAPKARVAGSEAATAKCRMRRFQEVMVRSDILTVDELSEYLHVHRTTIYRLLKHGKLPGFRVGS